MYIGKIIFCIIVNISILVIDIIYVLYVFYDGIKNINKLKFRIKELSDIFLNNFWINREIIGKRNVLRMCVKIKYINIY